MIRHTRRHCCALLASVVVLLPTLGLQGCGKESIAVLVARRDYHGFTYQHLEAGTVPALLVFYSDMRRLPSSREGLDALFDVPATSDDRDRWAGPYTDHPKHRICEDVLGHRVEYSLMRNPNAALITYRGRDEERRTSDDIYIVVQRVDANGDDSPRITAAVDGVNLLRQALALYRQDAKSYPFDLTDLICQRAKSNAAIEPYIPHPWKGPYASVETFERAAKAIGEHRLQPFSKKYRDRGFSLTLRIDNLDDRQGKHGTRAGDRDGDVDLGFVRRTDEEFDVFVVRRCVRTDPRG